MSRNISTGIDIGTYQVKVVVAEDVSENSGEKATPKIIGTGYAVSKGLRHGYILNQTDATRSLKSAIEQAEKSSGVKIKKTFLSIGGIGLGSVVLTGNTAISRADNEITELDLEKVVEVSQSEIPASFSLNRKIIHTVPIQYKIDGRNVLGRPNGMKGLKLEVKTLFINCLEHHLNDLIETVEEAGVEVEDVIAAPMAAALVTLSKTQKIAGCVLANIGSETVSIAVFENGIPISLEVFPIGSNDITNDIALGLKIPLEEAEEIKRGSVIGSTYPRKKLEEIIEARLSDIFDLIEAHLKKIGKNGLLPAGIVITGGGAGIENISELAKSILKLPAKVGSVSFSENSKGQIKDASWSVAYGLCILGLNGYESGSGLISNGNGGTRGGSTLIQRILEWIKQFLP
ncbi:MAG: cell division protein FtsA [Candidatus Paceibacterota bacterium]